MTMDDWFGLMVLASEFHISRWTAMAFCILLVFVLNYLMKELLMAMILEGFGDGLFEKKQDNFNEEGDENNEE